MRLAHSNTPHRFFKNILGQLFHSFNFPALEAFVLRDDIYSTHVETICHRITKAILGLSSKASGLTSFSFSGTWIQIDYQIKSWPLLRPKQL
jgi:hypothetical protein